MNLIALLSKLLPLIEQAAVLLKTGHKSWTVWAGALLIVFAGIQTMTDAITPFLGPYGALFSGVVGVVVIVLRVITTKPLSDK